MSLLIIGTKQYQSVRALPTETQCPHCRWRVYYHFVRTRRWLTYWFIPILPLSTTAQLICPVCTNGIPLTGREARHALRGELNLRVGE